MEVEAVKNAPFLELDKLGKAREAQAAVFQGKID
jgi:hypothetical protein